MEKGKMIASAAVIAVGLYLSGWALGHAIIEVKNRDRVVSVKGLAEREMPADMVIWPLTYKEIGDDLVSIYTTVNRKNETIISFLKKNGITDSEITVSAPQIIDMEAERYSSSRSPYRYNVTSVVTVTSGQVDKVRELMYEQTDLLKQGIAISVGEYQYRPQFMFTRLNDIKPEMIEEATKNARNAADKFAEDSDSRLGKIKKAYQGQFSIDDRDANTPYIKKIRIVTTVDYYLKD
ncbi:MAG: SIMPL domain-containing protein [Coprobacter sp.]|nr:SIMPL domain-containing protein [Coprobacter sp.]